ncbi:hypothetical protein [Burkholderia catarinensis]|uniref:hypothetical protein n=1 Tax=Burkholderia catarinensis TaxID=1108140 RepID=UPI001008337A|nr:hypothetical protein [Burkholderia catarinensis]
MEVERPTLLVLPTRLTLSPARKYRMVMKVLVVPRKSQVWRITFRPEEHIVVDVENAKSTPVPLFLSVGYGIVTYQSNGHKQHPFHFRKLISRLTNDFSLQANEIRKNL